MAHVNPPLVAETGTLSAGVITVSGAVTSPGTYRTFAAALTDGDTVDVVVRDAQGDQASYPASTWNETAGTLTLGSQGVSSGVITDGAVVVWAAQINSTLAVPTTDGASGQKTTGINAGATISAGQLLYLASDGEWSLADGDSSATTDKMLAVALEAGTDGNPVSVALPGSFVRLNSWSWTAGNAVYVSTTAGALSQTAPAGSGDTVRVIGYAISTNTIWFSPETGVTRA